MIGMRRPVKIALIAAAPIALLNLPPTFAIDVGLPDDAGWFERIIAGEWVVMHWLGLWVVQVLAKWHISLLNDNFMSVAISLAILSGYIEWALLIAAGIYAYQGARSFVRRFSARRV
jgi:hypothetical protein